MEELTNVSYYDWLINKIGGSCYRGSHYDNLLGILYREEFRWSVFMDKNRASDGLDLRTNYETEHGETAVDFEFPCSVLEMMIGLAIDISEIMWTSEEGFRTDEWFWNMIYNLELQSCCDEEWSENKEHTVRRTMQVLLDREYMMNGTGGLFPLIRPVRNQRRVEIWQQAMAWIHEKYGENG